VTGVAGLRLAADALLDLWDETGAGGGDRSAARRELLAESFNEFLRDSLPQRRLGSG